MPFKKVNPQKELDEACKNDKKMVKYIDDFNKQYDKKKTEKQIKKQLAF